MYKIVKFQIFNFPTEDRLANLSSTKLETVYYYIITQEIKCPILIFFDIICMNDLYFYYYYYLKH